VGVIALVLTIILLLLSPAAAEEVANETCLACHGTEGFASPTGRSLFIDAQAFGASTHGPLFCVNCHTDVTDIPHPEKLKKVGPETCATCHSDVVATYDRSIHGQARARGITDAATCVSCHGAPHSIRKHMDPESPVYPLSLPRTCGVCHGNPKLAKRYGIPVIDAYQLYMDSIHGRALTRSGLLVAANCSSCHGSHGILPKDDPDSKVYKSNIPATCGTCHAGVAQAYFQGAHGQALKDGKPKAPVCITCHTAHRIARVETVPWKLHVLHECGDCHEANLKTYRDTFHGQVTALGFTPVARCSDCHGAHRILPASDPQSSIAPQNLVTTCRKCHPQANENFVQFAPHADPDNRQKNPGLYYTAWLMELLIIGVFAFFGLHTILWFSRSLFGRRRAERTPEKPKEDTTEEHEE
jgi:nitrate/TMAO reductase-like tetraheme cytochrome c subunit